MITLSLRPLSITTSGVPVPGHATVDAEVDGVAEEDGRVDEHGDGVGQLVVHEVQIHGAVDGVERGHDHQGQLHREEDADHHDQHQGCVVGVPLALVLLASCSCPCSCSCSPALLLLAGHQALASIFRPVRGGVTE